MILFDGDRVFTFSVASAGISIEGSGPSSMDCKTDCEKAVLITPINKINGRAIKSFEKDSIFLV